MASKFYFRDSLNGEYEDNLIRSRYGEAINTGKIPEYRYRSHSNSSAGSCAEYEERVNHQHCDDAKVIKPILKKPVEVINYRAPTPPPIVQRYVEREPTPEPELIERITIRPQPQRVIERIIERPNTPPPRFITTEIDEPAPQPIVKTKVIKVDNSKRYYRNRSISPAQNSSFFQQSAASNHFSNYSHLSNSTPDLSRLHLNDRYGQSAGSSFALNSSNFAGSSFSVDDGYYGKRYASAGSTYGISPAGSYNGINHAGSFNGINHAGSAHAVNHSGSTFGVHQIDSAGSAYGINHAGTHQTAGSSFGVRPAPASAGSTFAIDPPNVQYVYPTNYKYKETRSVRQGRGLIGSLSRSISRSLSRNRNQEERLTNNAGSGYYVKPTTTYVGYSYANDASAGSSAMQYPKYFYPAHYGNLSSYYYQPQLVRTGMQQQPYRVSTKIKQLINGLF